MYDSLKQEMQADYDVAMSKFGSVTKIITAVKLPTGATELIINSESINTKMDYLNSSYDDDLRLKTNNQICIVGWMFV